MAGARAGVADEATDGEAAESAPRRRVEGPERRDRDAEVQKRLARIEGQVRGVSRMVAEGRYCVDVLTQVAAVHQALRQVSRELLAGHMESCVREAGDSGDEARWDEVSSEIAELMFKYSR